MPCIIKLKNNITKRLWFVILYPLPLFEGLRDIIFGIERRHVVTFGVSLIKLERIKEHGLGQGAGRFG